MLIEGHIFTIKTKDPENVAAVQGHGKNVIISGLNVLRDKIQNGDLAFVVFGGDKPSWKTGLVGIATVSKEPFDDGYDGKKNFRIGIDIVAYFDPITRGDLVTYPDTYDIIGISPITKWEPNQAITSVSRKKAISLLQAIADLRREVVTPMRQLLRDEYSELLVPINRYIETGGRSRTACYQDFNLPLQLITYGAPGTGKSHKVDGLAKNPDVAACVRTTFHPDSDYATFVGAYKPVMDGEKIAYKFRPQAFMNAYVKAWQEMSKPEADGKVKSVVLVIEEINRGNCAQIFGDLFQLLDRGKDGYSTYPIDADTDLATWLAEELGKLDADAQKRVPPEVRSGEKLVLPPNLYIWATMNTSDQSLFPIDSAFKRRWDWEYVPIAKPDKSGDSDWKERKIEVGDVLFDWWDFLSAINGHIAKATESEDKQLGYFFVKADDATGCISAEQFANKVLFYLYGDVFKSYELPKKDCFQQADNTVLKFRDFFYSEKVEEGEGENRVTHKPGDVKLDVVAAFLRGLKWKEKGVKEEPKGGAADANPD